MSSKKEQSKLDDALQVSTTVAKAQKDKFKLFDDLFESWIFEEIMPRGVKSLRSSMFYKFARKRLSADTLVPEDQKECELMLKKIWRTKENVHRIKKIEGKANAYELDFTVKKK